MTTTTHPTAPAGTTGLAVAPWTPGEWYAVAADWRQASDPVMALGDDGWHETGSQVADHQHDPAQALRAELAQALGAGGDDPDEADALVEYAVEIEG